MLYQGDFLSLKVKTDKNPRVHIIISKSIYSSAVKRNLLKRRIKSVVREFIGKKNLKLSIFVYTKKEIRDKKYKEIKNELVNLFKKANL